MERRILTSPDLNHMQIAPRMFINLVNNLCSRVDYFKYIEHKWMKMWERKKMAENPFYRALIIFVWKIAYAKRHLSKTKQQHQQMYFREICVVNTLKFCLCTLIHSIQFILCVCIFPCCVPLIRWILFFFIHVIQPITITDFFILSNENKNTRKTPAHNEIRPWRKMLINFCRLDKFSLYHSGAMFFFCRLSFSFWSCFFFVAVCYHFVLDSFSIWKLLLVLQASLLLILRSIPLY